MSAEDEVAAACCGLCCLCSYAGLNTWCNQSALGGRGGRGVAGCCGSCCNKSFNEDSMDKWDKDRAELRQAEPKATEPMTIPSASAAPASEGEKEKTTPPEAAK
ncbi:hypothetical protein FB45DRAFT_1004060 [Roridomyces roridus]|uniref:Uncharacterized protein n=1 Tax=Roridomyces roridus TaxID=1738132 RepID=A0AAD7BRI0_9AGAR|nr:hypothetical protein FB45DRAFT_1004060 [Roridomyces roridus]